MKYKYLIYIFLFVILNFSCRKEVTNPSPVVVDIPTSNTSAMGMYVLNEGNMDTNRASLDYVNFRTGTYTKDIYATANPTVVKGLGDVGNDIMVYGSKLYIVVNNSEKIEVLDVHTAKRINVIAIKNARYLSSYKGKVYCSSYKIGINDGTPAAQRNGYVAVIDTTTLSIDQKIEVGRQPEGMAIVGDKMYVANSGGYDYADASLGYDRTVSVIDLNSNQVVKKIDVAINLNHIEADSYGYIYVQSRGDYYDIPANLYVIDSKTNAVTRKFDIPISNFIIEGNRLYYYCNNYSKISVSYGKPIYQSINITTQTPVNESFINTAEAAKITMPYGMLIEPKSGNIYLADAKDYVSPGTLNCFDNSGNLLWSRIAGNIPAHFAFVYP